MKIESIKNNKGKWNFKYEDGSLVSKFWFDSIAKWNHYMNGHTTSGWDGLIHISLPTETPDSVYPYFVYARVYHYADNGELITVFNNGCGIYYSNEGNNK